MIVTPELKTIYANQTAKDLFGDGPEMFTEPCYRFFKNRETACEECPVLKSIQDEKSHQAIMKSYDKDGREMRRFNMAFPFYDPEGRVIAGIEIVSDYTAQKEAETALHESEKRLIEAQDILSLIVVPMLLKGRLVGFLGFDAVREHRTWTEDDQALGNGFPSLGGAGR